MRCQIKNVQGAAHSEWHVRLMPSLRLAHAQHWSKTNKQAYKQTQHTCIRSPSYQLIHRSTLAESKGRFDLRFEGSSGQFFQCCALTTLGHTNNQFINNQLYQSRERSISNSCILVYYHKLQTSLFLHKRGGGGVT